MKFFIVAAFALVACVVADVSELGYNYNEPAHSEPASVQSDAHSPAPQASAPAPQYSAPAPAPAQNIAPEPAPAAPVQSNAGSAAAASSSDDHQGYRYKTVRRVVYRHRA